MPDFDFGKIIDESLQKGTDLKRQLEAMWENARADLACAAGIMDQAAAQLRKRGVKAKVSRNPESASLSINGDSLILSIRLGRLSSLDWQGEDGSGHLVDTVVDASPESIFKLISDFVAVRCRVL